MDSTLKSSLEKLVIKWNSQVDEVLSRDSIESLGPGQSPNPQTELEFWRDKTENLQFVYDQLKEPTVKKVATILGRTESPYYSGFKGMLRNVVSGRRLGP